MQGPFSILVKVREFTEHFLHPVPSTGHYAEGELI